MIHEAGAKSGNTITHQKRCYSQTYGEYDLVCGRKHHNTASCSFTTRPRTTPSAMPYIVHSATLGGTPHISQRPLGIPSELNSAAIRVSVWKSSIRVVMSASVLLSLEFSGAFESVPDSSCFLIQFIFGRAVRTRKAQ